MAVRKKELLYMYQMFKLKKKLKIKQLESVKLPNIFI